VRPVTFAHPGDLQSLTGGYGYDRNVIAGLSDLGHAVEALHLPGAFPHPSADDVRAAAARLAQVTPERVLIVDGLAYGALPAACLCDVRAPIVALVHHPLALESGLDADRAFKLAVTERDALSAASAVVVTSCHTRDTLVAGFGVAASRIAVAPPGLDRAWRQAGMRRPADPPRIVSVGSVVPRKGYDVLVRALAALTDRQWSLSVFGSLDRAPQTVADLAATVDEAGLADRVTLAGEAGDETIRAAYREATLFALATRYEGFGMVFAEAMASGLPVVATRGGAVTEVVPSSAGILVDVDDSEGLAAALRRLLEEPSLCDSMSRGAAAAASGFHGWEETARIISGHIAGLGRAT